jgi:hypothetical protein
MVGIFGKMRNGDVPELFYFCRVFKGEILVVIRKLEMAWIKIRKT